MVANDTGLPYIDETEAPELFTGKGIDDRDQDWEAIGRQVAEIVQGMIDARDFVLHCPPFMPWLHLVRGALIIVMRRPVEEIVQSTKRIAWKRRRQELEYNKMGFTRCRLRGKVPTSAPLAELKYRYWDKYQKDLVAECLEVEYHSLQKHSLWVPSAERRYFRWNQTS
jgi:hypothetical protein